MANPREQLYLAPVTAKDSWLKAEIVGNGLWPQISEVIVIEVAHAVAGGGLDDIKAFQGSVLSNGQLAHWKKALNNMHKSHGIDIKTDHPYPQFTINDGHLNDIWNELQEETLKAIATYIRLSAPDLVEAPPYIRNDMNVITSYLDQSASTDNSAQLQHFFRTLHKGLHTKEAKKLAGSFKNNFRNFTGIDGVEKYQREVQNTRLQHRMTYGLIQHAVAAGYRQEFIEDFLFQTFDSLDPDVLNLVASIPAEGNITS